MEKKTPELKVKKSDVKPVELPDKGTQFGPPTGKEETEQDAQVDTRPRAERRRDHKAQMKQQKKLLSEVRKYQQKMARPLRYRDFPIIVQQVQMALSQQFAKIHNQLDKLSYLPDYVGERLSEHGIIINISIADFEEWFEKLKASLEAEDTPQEEASAPPDTEETQEEDPSG